MNETKVSTYGGTTTTSGFSTAKHWQLIYKGVFIADTSAPHIARVFEEIAEKLNGCE